MRNLIKFSVEKAITVFMVVIAVIIFGVVSFNRLTTDLFPDVNIPYAVVVTTYPGASHEEVEQEVTVPLENILLTTTNIKEVQSVSQENFSMIILEFSPATRMDNAVVEMRESLNFVLDDLPENASNPNIIRLNPDMLPVMNFSVSYEGIDLAELTAWVNEELSPRVERVEGVASLNLRGGYDSEIRVMIDADALQAVNDEIDTALSELKDILQAGGQELPEDFPDLTIDKNHIGNILNAQNFSFPAGFLNIENAAYLVRVGDGLEDIDTIRNLILFEFDAPMPQVNFPTVRIDDVATTDFVSARDQQYSKVNGSEAITISIQKGSEYATTNVTGGINDVLRQLSEEHEDFTVTILLDQGEYIEQSTGSVVNNLVIGGILAIIVLMIFLRSLRMTFIVGVAIPVSLLFAVVMIYLSGITLNIVSLGGLALGIGMLVDNSIVVIENIFRMKRDGASNKVAAIRGTHQVGGAIVASTLTTIGVFLPVMFIEDFIREIFYQLAMTITFSLVASLVIALTFVPAIANRIMKENGKTETVRTKGRSFEKIKNVYEKALRSVFRVKALVMVSVLLLFVAASTMAISRGFEFFPATDEGTLQATLEVRPDEPIDFTTISDRLDTLTDTLLDYDEVETVGITFGAGGAMSMGFGSIGSQDTATVNIVLREDRERSTMEMRDVIVALLERDYDMFDTSVQGTEMDTAALIGSGIQVRLRGNDLDELRQEALDLATALEEIDGLRDIDAGLGRESREIRITVDKEEAIKYGLTVGGVLGFMAEYLSAPSVQTVVRMNGQNYNLYVYDDGEESRVTLPTLDALRETVVGQDYITEEPVTLADVASVEFEPGFPVINRFNGARSITVSADFMTGYNTTLVANEVEDFMTTHELPSGFDYQILGEDEAVMEAINTLILVGALGILIVYMVMASQFQSFTYPFIIMTTIPLAFTGGFLILYVAGMPVSIVALIGLIILSGVVVNNGIVLVDYINQLRARNMKLTDAIVEAGRTRIRPIFMTALTTILALSAMAIGIGQGDELMQPMALTAIGGLVYATFLTIFIVPIMYYGMTKYGRYIFGGLIVLVGAASGVYFMTVQAWFNAGIWFAAALGALILMLALPKKPFVENSGSVISEHETGDDNDDA